jgi:hypothetical protein
MANLKNLQQAASEATGKGQAPKAPSSKAKSAPVTATAVPPPAKPNSRVGKIALTFHLPEDFKRSLRLIQAHRGAGCTLENLAAEAFNDLFAKYNVPTVANKDS